LLLSAGAPVPIGLQRMVADLLPNAEIHTPYGMTEALPVTDVSLTELAGLTGDGVCVGPAVPGVRVQISPLDADGSALSPPSDIVEVTGEICVSAGHVKDHYDRLWATESQSSRDAGWHRTGDVGYLDVDGRLWVQGRLRDVITTAAGPLTPVPFEQGIEALEYVRAAAVVGVGPPRSQLPVAIIVCDPISPGTAKPALRLADVDLSDRVRRQAKCEFAAVFIAQSLPVDIRHNSKIDRRALAVTATRALSGHTRFAWRAGIVRRAR
jgi:acyl-CoA synthetase (AMP-forming)/AMP-acid ligase II